MKQIIKLANGVEVENFSCTVGFRVQVQYQGRDRNVSLTDLTGSSMAITHSILYGMLQDAEAVIDTIKDSTEIAVLEMGNGISIKVWENK